MVSKYVKEMQKCAQVVEEQHQVIEGAVMLYGVAAESEAQNYHTMAHAALDTLLDAQRAKNRNAALAFRDSLGGL